ncbi:MAG: hypothetical protein ACYCZM_09850 [Acidimicrobiales bacterium]
MPLRIEIELTSVQADGNWTWRAAGARQPRGVLDGSILYEGAAAGDIIRADATVSIDGTTIVSVIPPKARQAGPAQIELLPAARDFQPVISTLNPKGSGRPRPGGDPRQGRPGGDAGRVRPGGTGPDRSRSDRPRREGRPDGASPRRANDTHPPGPASTTRTSATPGSAGGQRGRPATRPEAKSRRFNPGNLHRAAVVAGLPPEQQPIADQLLKGGMPGVRQAIEAQNAQAKAEGRPEVNPQPLLSMAEALLPALKAATWRDRAEAAQAGLGELSLRDLRSVVTGSDAMARDDETRLLASSLREALEARVTKLRQSWVDEITRAIEDGKLIKALRASARPPEPTARFPAELAVRLSEAAGAGMSSELSPERWMAMMEAVADSPVRRSVKPVGLPAEPDPALMEQAKHLCGRIPGMAGLLGMNMPPPPGPPRPPARPPRPPSPSPAPAPPVEATSPSALEPAAGPDAEAASPPLVG